ncbi:MAG: glycogen/starch/alpha-glucan phosphorylase, partial [Alphaproteobacteria bacterium]|nr:glycogen/starch/alpha-glucan phosphorylase [Alphaproteobacteria bacterium]
MSIRQNKHALAAQILDTLVRRTGKDQHAARPHDWLAATILTVRDDIIERWIASTKEAYENGAKRVYYLSLEFLIGRLLRDAITNLGRMEDVRDALAELDVDLAEIEEIEPDAALGNGGLGRLAACFMESLATLGIPGYGYGIRYINGMFRQRIDDGWQVELPESWLFHG